MFGYLCFTTTPENTLKLHLPEINAVPLCNESTLFLLLHHSLLLYTKVLTLYNQVAEVGYAIICIIISYIPGGPYAVEDFSLLLSSLTPKHPSRKCVSRVNVMCWNAVKTFQGLSQHFIYRLHRFVLQFTSSR